MSYLFDTDALSEILKPRPAPDFLRWLRSTSPRDHHTSAVVVGELYKGAFRSPAREKWLRRIEEEILPRVTVLPYDAVVARVYGEIRAEMERRGRMPGEADLQIAATSLRHHLVVVTGNLRHYEEIPQVIVSPVLAEARAKTGAGRY